MLNRFEWLHRFRLASALVLLTVLLRCPVFGQAPAEADRLFAQGQFEAAQKTYAASADPAAAVGRVRSLLRLDRWADAEAAAQSFVAKVPGSADAHGLLALALIRAGWQPPYAEEAARSLALDPQNYWGLVASGRVADWDGHVEDARTLFRRASALHPEWPDAWGDLYLVDDDRGHIKEQLAVAQAYVKLNPQGHPHDENAEDARDLLAHTSNYQTAFEMDPPYQHSRSPQENAAEANAAKSSSMTVEFIGDYVLFPVVIDGSPFRLLFDTGGGDDILLETNAARRLHLPLVAHSYVRGVSGKEKSDTLKAQTLTLTGLTYKSIKIETVTALEGTGNGILGGNILRDSVVTLDFEHRTATFTQGAAAQAPATLPGDGSVSLPFHFYHGDLYVQLALNNVPVWALVDTGADTTTLSLRFAKQQLKNAPKEDVRNGTDTGRHGVGNTDTRMEYIVSREESQIRLSQTPPVFVPMPTIGTSDADRAVSPSAGCDFEVSLWLGMSSLTYARRVTFDYPRHLMTFEYANPDPAPDAAPKPKK